MPCGGSLGCPTPARNDGRAVSVGLSEAAPHADAEALPLLDALPGRDAEVEAAAFAAEDAEPLRRSTTEGFLALIPIALPDGGADGGISRTEIILRSLVAPVPGRFNQGNAAKGRHDIPRSACLEGLRGITLQTEEQKKTCHGMENMVPIYTGGNPDTAKTCIDIFEFPNRPCELPMVWGTPSGAERICQLEGKRLCKQEEWNLACRGDPEGKADWTYAYGNEQDMTICNTNKPHATAPNGQWYCSAQTAQTAWETCATETEPSGGFPKCRSRFGVFDQHGNVAEMMTRKDTDGAVYTQLKGSAFFYVDVERLPTEAQKPGGRETYPDHCNYDPRWHVEPLDGSMHSNYHLGFRCCLPL
jgi:sulfatase modifying factor 1